MFSNFSIKILPHRGMARAGGSRALRDRRRLCAGKPAGDASGRVFRRFPVPVSVRPADGPALAHHGHDDGSGARPGRSAGNDMGEKPPDRQEFVLSDQDRRRFA